MASPMTPLPAGYRITSRTPTAAEHQNLRRSAGLGTQFPLAATEAALPFTWYAVVIEHTSSAEAVGMGRIIGDGQLFLQIVDVAVDPAHQRKGLGRAVLRALLDHVKSAAPSAYVSLIGDPPGHTLYKSLGFLDTAPSLGMWLPRASRK